MTSRRFTALIVTAAVASVPAGALASSGEDQYCDPFDGCGATTKTHGHRGGGHSGGGGRTSRDREALKAVLRGEASTRSFGAIKLALLAREAARPGGSPLADVAYRRVMRLKAAMAVLDAAGLSSLGPTVR